MKKFKYALGVLCISLTVSGVRAAPVAGTPEEVATRLERAIDRASEQGNYQHVQSLRMELAQHYVNTGAYALAARQYELLLASRPSRGERVKFFIELGKMRDADHNYSGAIQAFEDALHDEASSWEANLNLARAYDQAELNSRAIEVYKRCISLKPAAWEPYEGIAHVYQELGFLNKAVLNYQKSITLEKQPETYLELADAYVHQGDVASAKDILQQAKAVLPRADYDVRLGEIYSHHGDLRMACAAWEEALKSDSHRDDVRLQLALAYDRLDRTVDSDRMFRRLMAAYPLSPLVHYSRAWVLYARGDRTGARHEALAVQQLGPTAVVGHFNEELLAQLGKGKAG